MAFVLAACGAGNGDGLDENGVPLGQAATLSCGTAGTPTPNAPGAPFDATLAAIQANVFTPVCSVPGCHGGASAQQGLRFDAGLAARNLICVHLPRDPTQIRVIPGDPDGSFIIHKLEGTQNIGDRMPDGGPYLPQSTIDVIRVWIANGAPAQ